MNHMNYIYKFEPYLKPVIWGGDRIAALKGIPCDRSDIGESWEISAVKGHESVVAEGSEEGLTLPELIKAHRERLTGKHVWQKYGTEFPLLIKIIDARRDLSVQVHPDDALAAKRHGCAGKTEMWYILDTTPDAKIYAGLSCGISPEQYTQLVSDHAIMDVVASHDSHPGDVFFLPAGRIHAIGAGNLLVEVQQTSDITYRVYDYGRKDAGGKERELHTELAKEAIDYKVYPDYVTDYDREAQEATLVKCEYFKVDRIKVSGETMLPPADDSFTVIVCTDGSCSVSAGGQNVTLRAGESALVCADTESITCSGSATLVTATC